MTELPDQSVIDEWVLNNIRFKYVRNGEIAFDAPKPEWGDVEVAPGLTWWDAFRANIIEMAPDFRLLASIPKFAETIQLKP